MLLSKRVKASGTLLHDTWHIVEWKQESTYGLRHP
jgi:hypothetical protein